MMARTMAVSNPRVCECGYKYLVKPTDELKCVICLDVAEDPLQHEKCGKLFCKECLEKYGRKKPCPNCRQEEAYFFDDIRGMIMQYLISIIIRASIVLSKNLAHYAPIMLRPLFVA